MSVEDTLKDEEPEKPEDFIWNTYLKVSEKDDKTRPENWNGSTTGMLTFTGLFAATVAAFIIESYTLLSPDSSERTNELLEQLFVAMANTSSNIPVNIPPPASFSPPPTAVVTNVFWFSSLLIALICALLSTLVQEWSRSYMHDIDKRTLLHESLRRRTWNHIYIHMGVNRYGMDQVVSWIVALVHLSVFLFACGLLTFLFPINHVVVGISTGVLGIFLIIYCVGSVIPLLDKSCPYRTPASYMIAFVYWITLHCWAAIAQLRLQSRRIPKIDDLRQLVTRQYTGAERDFLTDPRFLFVWESTYPQINDDNRATYFRGLPSLITSRENREALLSRMCADSRLMIRLFRFLRDSYSDMPAEASFLSIDCEIFELIALLSQRMYALEVEHYGEHLEGSIMTSSWHIDIMGYVSRNAKIDGPSQLSARLCLAYVRQSLLGLCRKAFDKKMPPLCEDEASDFSREVFQFDFHSGNCNPGAFLLLLTAGSYEQNFWEHTGASVLLPLHDDDCCRDWTSCLTPEGLAHVAACHAVTTIADVLASSDSQRNHATKLFVGYLFASLQNWDSAFGMPANKGRKMLGPSLQFVSVLRSAGLHEWLEPGSTFDTEPREGPNYKLLTREYTGSFYVWVLRQLAQHVDFAVYREHCLKAASPYGTSPPSHGKAIVANGEYAPGADSEQDRTNDATSDAGLLADVHHREIVPDNAEDVHTSTPLGTGKRVRVRSNSLGSSDLTSVRIDPSTQGGKADVARG